VTSASNHQRDIDTDLVRKTVDAMQARQSPPEQRAECVKHESRIVALERDVTDLRATTADHGTRLHQGDIGFVQIRADLHALTKAVTDAVEQMKAASGFNWQHQALSALINWGVPIAILILVWALVGSGAVPLKGHP
jgi:hypothetical protein